MSAGDLSVFSLNSKFFPSNFWQNLLIFFLHKIIYLKYYLILRNPQSEKITKLKLKWANEVNNRDDARLQQFSNLVDPIYQTNQNRI